MQAAEAAESMEERHDKVETKGESCKNSVITTAETKIEICYWSEWETLYKQTEKEKKNLIKVLVAINCNSTLLFLTT